ncbi:alpha/beta hydrolase [Rhodococcus sp. IEGM 1343]|uniref:alpha/beta fold hydrolase n=1 Tax=Rhodococcus sp. IEGM 1343 TaxID=3082224 RepID=UPI002954A4B3|nr:alpha/beta hydrolase [Rhodococcus sp. IEGM 1343]MDV8058403.1 alpha/beta hydrolase [Rhodococcus sp. IEGM 1343]
MTIDRFDLPEPIFVSVGGDSVATYEMAPDRAEPSADVVFCHGTPWSAQVWGHAARHLSAGHRVYLWDMPGYGRSAQGPDIRTDLPTQMLRFALLLDHWQLTRPFVVAHDIGGAVALGAHLLHGCDFGGLYLWDVVTLNPWGSEFFRLVADNAEVFAALPARLHSALVTEYIAGAAHQRLDADIVAMLTEPWLSDEGQPAFYRQIAELRPGHTRPIVDALPRVRCNTTIGWGEQDPWIPVEQAFRLRQLLPGEPSVITVPGVGHLTPLEAPSVTAEALDAWLGMLVRELPRSPRSCS